MERASGKVIGSAPKISRTTRWLMMVMAMVDGGDGHHMNDVISKLEKLCTVLSPFYHVYL